VIDTTSNLSNTLVVGTAVRFEPNGLLDNMFGIVLALPGTPLAAASAQGEDIPEEARRILIDVARYYLEQATGSGYVLQGLDEPAAVQRIGQAARSPADVEDIVVLCQTTALYRQRSGATKFPEITAEVIEKSIRRVIVRRRDVICLCPLALDGKLFGQLRFQIGQILRDRHAHSAHLPEDRFQPLKGFVPVLDLAVHLGEPEGERRLQILAIHRHGYYLQRIRPRRQHNMLPGAAGRLLTADRQMRAQTNQH
jgi:hypothetical protein